MAYYVPSFHPGPPIFTAKAAYTKLAFRRGDFTLLRYNAFKSLAWKYYTVFLLGHARLAFYVCDDALIFSL